MTHFLKLCVKREITNTAVKTALVAGTILTLINHFHSIVKLSFEGVQVIQITITYLVPYVVSVLGGASYAQHIHAKQDTENTPSPYKEANTDR